MIAIGADNGGADAGKLVGDDAHADAVRTDEDATRRLTAGHPLGDVPAEVGIVDGRGTVGADVDDLLAADAQLRDEGLFELEAAVVRPDRDHRPCTLTSCGSRCS